MDNNRSNVIILVTGFKEREPWNSNWKECERTWVPLVRKLGYDVKISFGDPTIDDYFLDEGNHIHFKASTGLDGVLDKRLKLPIKWILEHTNYDYYFCIDSDCFVHPERFDKMLTENIKNHNPDYMGCKIPVTGLNTSIKQTFYEPIDYESDVNYYASGSAYMISRKIMPIVLPKLWPFENQKFTKEKQLEIDDWVLGKVVKLENIQLLNDTAISIESPQRPSIMNPLGIPIPYIGDKDSFLAIQHYTDGLMDEIILSLWYVFKKWM